MRILGIYDWHNCGASLVEDGKIKVAIEEDRLSRNKIAFGFPILSINKIFDMSGTGWKDLDAIAVCGERDPFFLARINPKRFKFERAMGRKWWIQYKLWRMIQLFREKDYLLNLEKLFNKYIITHQIKNFSNFHPDKIFMLDHHLCHASSGYRTSGFHKAIIFTIDGSGDGYSTAIFFGDNGNIRFLTGSSERASLCKLYSNVTLGLGFEKLTGEGKVMGLAASGDPEPFYPIIDNVIKIKNYEPLCMEVTEDLVGNSFAKKVQQFLRSYKREDIAAATQKKFESVLEKIIYYYVQKMGIANVVLVGGGAMNVRLNQKVRELDCVEKSYIFPNMTDGGASSGAALETHWVLTGKNGVYELEDAFLGPQCSNENIKTVISDNNLQFEYCEDIETTIAHLVCDGFIVARVKGRMEYGPRALGNRSILCLPFRKDVEKTLNERLKRGEFMPFAPSILEEYAPRYLKNYVYSPFMVETFDLNEKYLHTFPAIVHIDKTVRPQIVRKSVCPDYWAIIKTIGDITGYYIVLNTSYNMHGEPIVCSGYDAINTFKKSAVDYLCLENYLIKYISS